VRAARDLIREVGVDGLTMRRLSTDLGVALGATYHHVPTKRELLVLVAHDLYDEVAQPPPGRKWDARVKALMVSVAATIGRYPGMARFMNENVDDVVPESLRHTVVGLLHDAGFSDQAMTPVLTALFFYVTGVVASGASASSQTSLRDADMQARFEDGLDVLLAGARARLQQERRTSRTTPPRQENIA
jgi:AcrR family transcriptional regulator